MRVGTFASIVSFVSVLSPPLELTYFLDVEGSGSAMDGD